MNYKKELDKVMKATGDFVYRGCVVKRLIGGFRVLGQIAKNEQELDRIIDNAIGKLSESATKQTEV